MIYDWWNDKDRSVADYLNNFEKRKRFNNKMRTILILFFLITYAFLLGDKTYELFLENKRESLTKDYLRKDSVYRDSLNFVIEDMKIELETMKKELSKKRKR